MGHVLCGAQLRLISEINDLTILGQVFGAFTSVWGIILLVFLPDTPASATFLKQDQKIIAVKRVAGNRVDRLPLAFPPQLTFV